MICSVVQHNLFNCDHFPLCEILHTTFGELIGKYADFPVAVLTNIRVFFGSINCVTLPITLRKEASMVDEITFSKRAMADTTIYILDSDLASCEHLSVLFRLEGYATHFFLDTDSFIRAASKRSPNLVVMKSIVAEQSTIPALMQFKTETYGIPVIVIEATQSVDAAVAAMKAGARDVCSMPLDSEHLLGITRNALRQQFQAVAGSTKIEIRGFNSLTEREREVLNLIANGESNKGAAKVLGISDRTVEVHRSRIMHKMNAKNVADLVRIVLQTGP